MKSIMQYKRVGWAVLLWCFAFVAMAQYSIEVKAPSVVNLAEGDFKVEFRINSLEVEKLGLASTPDFDVYSGPVKSVFRSSVYINGKHSKEEATIVTYILAPTKEGKLKLGTFTAVVDGKTIKAPATVINVIKENGSAAAGASAEGVSTNGVTIKTLASRQKVYEQQAVLLTYKYYAHPRYQLVGAGIQQKPDFKGVISQDLPIRDIFVNIEHAGGQPIVTGVVAKNLVFPQRSGKVSIPGITFNFDVQQRREFEDPFDAFLNGGMSTITSIKRKSNDVELEVLPLPQPQPAQFSGAVGLFTVRGEMLSKEFRTNDVATFRLIIEGTGNLKLMSAPQLQLPKDFDVYTPKVTDETEVTEEGVSGRMIYDYTFVPRVVDQYTLEPMTFVFFDPEKEKYETVKTETFRLDVKQGEKTNEEYQRSQELRRSDIREFRKTGTALTQWNEVYWWGGVAYWMAVVAMVLLAMLAFAVLNKFRAAHADVMTNRSKKAGKVAVNRMKQAKTYLDRQDRNGFYAEVTKALYGYVADKFALQLAELNRSNIEAQFVEHSVKAETSTQFLQILDECEFARYAPSDQVMGMQQMYDAVIAVIIAIENNP